jgi:signal transduction histidine kinase
MKFTIDRKITLFIVGIIFALSSMLGYYFLWTQKKTLNHELDERLSVLLDNLSRNLEYPVLVKDQEAISRLVGGVMAQKEVRYCRVEGKDGGVLYNAGTGKGSPVREYAASIVTKTGGVGEGLILDVPGEIREKVGKVYLLASLSGLNEKIYVVQRTIFALVAGVIVCSSLGAYLLIRRIIGKPVALLVEATERISSGDLSHRVPLETGDELGALAGSFNRMTESLCDAQEELVRKEKLSILGQLSGSVGHELRNPLGVMSNAVYFLQMVLVEADETTKEYLGIIKHEIDNSQRIITDLLDFARTKTPQTKAVTARELVNESLGRCTIPENVELRTELPETLPLLKVDPLQMGQVLQNLITNGVQAMPNGGSVRIAARLAGAGLVPARVQEGQPQGLPLQETGDFIEISVADSGEGIAPENMKKLFQPLFTTKAKGIGLGLVVCKNLVEANGGRIEVESAVGQGTTFTVMLPVEGGEA